MKKPMTKNPFTVLNTLELVGEAGAGVGVLFREQGCVASPYLCQSPQKKQICIGIIFELWKGRWGKPLGSVTWDPPNQI
jgi:hypothetical protein